MSRTSDHPALTPQFCFNQTALRDFLRLSRASLDDTITQNLNALSTPSTTNRFSSRSTAPGPRSSRAGALPPAACTTFLDTLLFPTWQSRSDVLTYCAGVATSPDPDDPEQLLRETESARARERLVDARLDPYSARYLPREARTEALAGLIRNERAVEGIVRQRTWGLVRERCFLDGAGGKGSDSAEAEEALDAWRRRRQREQ